MRSLRINPARDASQAQRDGNQVSMDRTDQGQQYKFANNTNQGEIIMRFLSVYKTPERNAPPTPEEMAKMGKLIEDGMKAGFLLAVEGCLPSATGARVRQSNGSVTVTDGPFTESKEVIGGLALLQANSREEAVKLVKDFLRVAGDGECELRQLYEAPAGGVAKS
jgi:hypothetical protein